jgi:hypothetical protein
LNPNRKKIWATIVGEPTTKNLSGMTMPKIPANDWFWGQVGKVMGTFYTRQEAEAELIRCGGGYGLWNYHAKKIAPTRKADEIKQQ